MRYRHWLTALIVILSCRLSASAAPPLLHYQGRLVTTEGRLAADGAYDMQFAIFDARENGTELWVEHWDTGSRQVEVKNGIYSVALGTHNTIDLPFDQQYWFEVRVKYGAALETLSPRQPLGSAPYAMRAFDADKLGGEDATFYRDAANLSTGVLDVARIPDLDASKIATGILETDRIPNLDADKVGSGAFSPDRIPALDASKIASGTIDPERIADLDASKVATGVLDPARIPDLDASKIASGELPAERIEDLDADKVTSGVFHPDRIPDLDASKITTGLIDPERLRDLDASKITSGVFHPDRIPGLDASKIISGKIPEELLPPMVMQTIQQNLLEIIKAQMKIYDTLGMEYEPYAGLYFDENPVVMNQRDAATDTKKAWADILTDFDSYVSHIWWSNNDRDIVFVTYKDPGGNYRCSTVHYPMGIEIATAEISELPAGDIASPPLDADPNDDIQTRRGVSALSPIVPTVSGNLVMLRHIDYQQELGTQASGTGWVKTYFTYNVYAPNGTKLSGGETVGMNKTAHSSYDWDLDCYHTPAWNWNYGFVGTKDYIACTTGHYIEREDRDEDADADDQEYRYKYTHLNVFDVNGTSLNGRFKQLTYRYEDEEEDGDTREDDKDYDGEYNPGRLYFLNDTLYISVDRHDYYESEDRDGDSDDERDNRGIRLMKIGPADPALAHTDLINWQSGENSEDYSSSSGLTRLELPTASAYGVTRYGRDYSSSTDYEAKAYWNIYDFETESSIASWSGSATAESPNRVYEHASFPNKGKNWIQVQFYCNGGSAANPNWRIYRMDTGEMYQSYATFGDVSSQTPNVEDSMGRVGLVNSSGVDGAWNNYLLLQNGSVFVDLGIVPTSIYVSPDTNVPHLIREQDYKNLVFYVSDDDWVTQFGPYPVGSKQAVPLTQSYFWIKLAAQNDGLCTKVQNNKLVFRYEVE